MPTVYPGVCGLGRGSAQQEEIHDMKTKKSLLEVREIGFPTKWYPKHLWSITLDPMKSPDWCTGSHEIAPGFPPLPDLETSGLGPLRLWRSQRSWDVAQGETWTIPGSEMAMAWCKNRWLVGRLVQSITNNGSGW